MTAPDTNAIRAQMEALTGFTAGPWRDEDGVIQSQTTVWQNGVKQVGWDYAAIRAEVTDDWDQAANARLIAAAPDMHATILALCDALDDAKAENERLQAIIDNLHAVEEKLRETANAQLHRANRLQVEKGRLRGLLAEAIQWNWIDFEEVPTESSEACLPLLVDLHQRIKSAIAQKGGE